MGKNADLLIAEMDQHQHDHSLATPER